MTSGDAGPRRYSVVVNGPLGPLLRAAFPELRLSVTPAQSVLIVADHHRGVDHVVGSLTSAGIRVLAVHRVGEGAHRASPGTPH